MSIDTATDTTLVFEDDEITTTRSNAADKPNRFLDVVKDLPVQETGPNKTYKVKKVTLPLDGELVPIGAAKDADGNKIADEDRDQQDTAVVAVRRELDAAGSTCSVTVRKKFELIALDVNGQPNTRKNAKNTHVRVSFWTTPKQARKRVETAADESDTAPVVE